MKRIIGGEYSDVVTELEKLNAEVAYRSALETFVLLKNDGCLPLKDNNISLFGVGATHTIKGGTGSGETNNRHSISIYEGFKNAGYVIDSENYLKEYIDMEDAYHKKWIKDNTGMPSFTNLGKNYILPNPRAINDKDFADCDRNVALYVVSRQSGEAANKQINLNDYNLMPNEINDINYLHKNYKHVVVIINSGTSLDLSPIDNLNVSIVFFGQAGQEGGKALVDVLSGKSYFSGKLSTTWAKQYCDIPYGNEYSYMDNDVSNEYYKEGIYVGYRYFDTFGVEPRFHFGYGLTYTDFELETVNKSINGSQINLSVKVRNVGNHKGKEVVQVYASLPQGKLDKEYQRLVAFKKTKELDINEEEVLDIRFDVEYLSSFDEESLETILEKGDYVLKVGNASNNNKPVLVLELKDDLVISKHDPIFKTDEKVDLLVSEVKYDYDLNNVDRIVFDSNSVKTKEFNYGKPEIYHDEKVDAILNQLDEKELVDVCTGIGTMGMVNTDGFCTPGVAGKTTLNLFNKGLISVNLADGPTGLRILRRTAITPKGGIRMFDGEYLFSFMETMPKWLLMFAKPRKKDIKFYQFATAFPVGTNLAQTWNEELISEIGQAVSKEMDKFNITYWLAPGMNIQRNPLCGRNFEYYSEDPVLSGKISAAMTRGVQMIDGNYTTIKHFACNNTEDNRERSNSHVSQRTLREIYLKGFEINIKEAGSKSIMTSYNLINGTYTPDSYDLNTKVLRNEWGFDGVVMTDWYSTRPGQGHTDLAIANGNDMIMPGDKVYDKTILEGLKKDTVSLDDLKRAAANIIRSIVYSNVAKKYNAEDFIEEK